jgi:ribonuclease R
VVIDIDDNGDILNEWYGRTIIHSNKRFTYEEAQDIIEYNHETNLSSEVKLLNNLAKKLRSKRISNGSIEMDGAEVKFKLDDAKKPVSVYFKKQKDSNKLIEEFMLLANKSVAKFIKSKLGFCVNRVHPKPDLDKLNELKKISNEFGYKLDISNQVSLKYNINNLINDIKGKPEENFITNLIIRSQNKAYYTTEDIPHYGLSFDDYCHFTSCIRRYSDVITHRLLSESLKNNGYNEYR